MGMKAPQDTDLPPAKQGNWIREMDEHIHGRQNQMEPFASPVEPGHVLPYFVLSGSCGL